MDKWMNEWITDFPSQVTNPKKGAAPLKHVFQAISNNKNNSYNLLSTYYVLETMLRTLRIT